MDWGTEGEGHFSKLLCTYTCTYVPIYVWMPRRIIGEYTVNHVRDTCVMQGIFPNWGILGFLDMLMHFFMHLQPKTLLFGGSETMLWATTGLRVRSPH